jgi:NADPH2:quinone reductase
MKAVVALRTGTWSEVLKLTDHAPIGSVPPDALHVRVRACGMGFPDLLQVEGKYQAKAEPPFVPAGYVSGEVIALGPGVDPAKFKVGDRVVGSAVPDASGHLRGGLAEEALLDAATAVQVPDFMSDATVLAMHENYWDVHHGISTCGKVGPGDTLLVLGASGACGMAAVDLGKALGARVVACASNTEKIEACRRAGADEVVNYGEDADYDRFLGILKGAGLYGKVNAVFDPVGGGYGEAAFRAMARAGRYVLFGFASGGTDPKSAFPNFPINLLLMKGQQLLGSMGSSRGEKIEEMFQMVKDGSLRPGAGAATGSGPGYRLDDFLDAFGAIATRRAIGKVVVDVAV